MVNEDASEFPLPLLPKQPIETAIPKGAGLVPEVRELLEKENRQPLVQIKSRHAAEEGLGPRISKKQKVDKNAGRHGQGKKKDISFKATTCRCDCSKDNRSAGA
ncbi:uncharacterized protein LOC127860204 [Dreissena polymorpha]|uniref:uncharacterized protein LOC127860204 n=1 Tax=Dreissena polymorpha TaxID=45954 RepID=UPI0022651EED|nr:uncharacterized protein LOC127860204 [Dreissena polymorpha]